GTGLIGRALSDELLDNGHQVVVLSRNPARAAPMPKGVEVLRWDARTPHGWGAAVEEIDAVVNLAGESLPTGPITRERKRRVLSSRLNVGHALVEAIAKADHKPKVLVQASGIGYYGDGGDDILTEAAPPGSDWFAGVAVKWENATADVEQYGVRRVIIRTGLVLSDEGGILTPLTLPLKLYVGGHFGNGRQYMPWIHIDDEVGAIRFLLEQDEADGPYNLSSPNPVTNADLYQVLGEVMHRPTWLPVPSWSLRLVLGDMAPLLLSGQRAVPERLEELGYPFRYRHLRDAAEDLLAS
ncbi:MAG: TIGR01777 family oxidoreductase, partial [Anaerolineae bacterium]